MQLLTSLPSSPRHLSRPLPPSPCLVHRGSLTAAQPLYPVRTSAQWEASAVYPLLSNACSDVYHTPSVASISTRSVSPSITAGLQRFAASPLRRDLASETTFHPLHLASSSSSFSGRVSPSQAGSFALPTSAVMVGSVKLPPRRSISVRRGSYASSPPPRPRVTSNEPIRHYSSMAVPTACSAGAQEASSSLQVSNSSVGPFVRTASVSSTAAPAPQGVLSHEDITNLRSSLLDQINDVKKEIARIQQEKHFQQRRIQAQRHQQLQPQLEQQQPTSPAVTTTVRSQLSNLPEHQQLLTPNNRTRRISNGFREPDDALLHARQSRPSNALLLGSGASAQVDEVGSCRLAVQLAAVQILQRYWRRRKSLRSMRRSEIRMPGHATVTLRCRKGAAVHHAAVRIQRAWKINRWRKTFVHFSELQVGWLGSLDWLHRNQQLYGTELAEAEDLKEWAEQREVAPLDHEVDPWGCTQLRTHLHRMWYGYSQEEVDNAAEIAAASSSSALRASTKSTRTTSPTRQASRSSSSQRFRYATLPAGLGQANNVFGATTRRTQTITSGSAAVALLSPRVESRRSNTYVQAQAPLLATSRMRASIGSVGSAAVPVAHQSPIRAQRVSQTSPLRAVVSDAVRVQQSLPSLSSSLTLPVAMGAQVKRQNLSARSPPNAPNLQMAYPVQKGRSHVIPIAAG